MLSPVNCKHSDNVMKITVNVFCSDGTIYNCEDRVKVTSVDDYIDCVLSDRPNWVSYTVIRGSV